MNDNVNQSLIGAELPELPPLPPIPPAASAAVPGDDKFLSESDIGNAPKTHVIVIEESSDKDDSPDVFVSVNGRAFLIKRGVEVPISLHIKNALDAAVADKIIDDGEGNRRVRSYKRFPYRIVREL